jgi:hypothetical protein
MTPPKGLIVDATALVLFAQNQGHFYLLIHVKCYL